MSEPLLSSTAAQHLGTAANAIGNDPRLSFLKRFREERLSNLRGLGDFFDKNRISFTTSFSTISQRWNYNLQYFSANYLLIVLGLSIYAILTSWWLLFSIAFIVGGFYLISRLDGPLTIGGNSISPSTLYASYAGASLILLLFSGATGVVFWIIGAGAIIILGHAAILEPSLESEFGADGQV
ncbi:PRA1 family protein-domain-containing protein [Radiomyces spectabilis]|uniref:PRA1 family protein-domain-containing protein n=1 Tax=Radiomyces spectabilis TaxID=64574 RepID=UPI002221214F|nr:PRA1 family protein-domain-containing protein [Radiomyces spectabilis]KAI8367599.1 PRA1 family protein-domain-containing protein [Radiomyces spectabilis]